MELAPTPARLAHVAVRRCLSLMSYESIAHSLAAEGPVRSSTLRTWLESCAAQLAPLVHAMWTDASHQIYLACDLVEHGVHDKLWVVASPAGHVLFTLDLARMDAMLGDFAGFFVSDSRIVDEHLQRSNSIDHPWITTRRHFLGLLDADPTLAREALAKIAAIHARHDELGFAERSLRRQLVLRCKPLVHEFLAWCSRRHEDPRAHAIAPAIRHVLRHRTELETYYRDARSLLLPPRVRPPFVEREVGCVLLSLLASCHVHDLEPQRYLHDMLLMVPTRETNLLALSPAHWRSER